MQNCGVLETATNEERIVSGMRAEAEVPWTMRNNCKKIEFLLHEVYATKVRNESMLAKSKIERFLLLMPP